MDSHVKPVAIAVVALVLVVGGVLLFAPPLSYLTRSQLPSCGVEDTRGGGQWNIEARQCFWEAYQAGREAEFVSTRPTVEGDPFTVTLRVLGPSRVEIFIDATRDAYGGGWHRLTCGSLALSDSPQPIPDFVWGDGCETVSI